MTITLTIDLEPQTQTQKEILMKLSELAAALAVLNSQVATIGANVQALKDGSANAELPAEAATNLVQLQTGLQVVADMVAPPPTV